jgi:hypothetical protein
MLRYFNCTWLILGVSVIFFSVLGVLYYNRRSSGKTLLVAKSVNNNLESIKGSSKIVSITKDAVYEQK